MKLLLLVLATLELSAAALYAGETPETILIRQALGNDLAGRRRGDTEVALSAYAENFVAYDAAQSVDPRQWKILHEDLDSYQAALQTDLKAKRYDIERFVATIQVRGDKATATTMDSGSVVQRQGGERQPLRREQFWTFLKKEGKWLITAQVQQLGTEEPALPPRQAPDGDLAALLQREEEAWDEGSTGLADLFAKDFVCFDAADKTQPSTWTIIFGSEEEWRNWLDKRFQNTSYTVERQILHTALGPQGQEGLALSRDRFVATHANGPEEHTREQYVLWFLSQRDGSWKVTNMLYGLGLPQ